MGICGKCENYNSKYCRICKFGNNCADSDDRSNYLNLFQLRIISLNSDNLIAINTRFNKHEQMINTLKEKEAVNMRVTNALEKRIEELKAKIQFIKEQGNFI